MVSFIDNNQPERVGGKSRKPLVSAHALHARDHDRRREHSADVNGSLGHLDADLVLVTTKPVADDLLACLVDQLLGMSDDQHPLVTLLDVTARKLSHHHGFPEPGWAHHQCTLLLRKGLFGGIDSQPLHVIWLDVWPKDAILHDVTHSRRSNSVRISKQTSGDQTIANRSACSLVPGNPTSSPASSAARRRACRWSLLRGSS